MLVNNIYQSKHNEEYLNDVSVSHGDESTEESVAESNDSGHDDGNLLVEVEDDLERGAECSEDGG